MFLKAVIYTFLKHPRTSRMVWYEKLNHQLNRLPVHMQVPDLWTWITHGNLSVRFQVLIFYLKIPAGQVQVDPQVNSWHALALGYEKFPIGYDNF